VMVMRGEPARIQGHGQLDCSYGGVISHLGKLFDILLNQMNTREIV
jgi:hypothetical protein